MNELKPCPFCGSPVSYWHDIEFNPVGVQCMKCGIAIKVFRLRKGKTFGDAMKQIAERWNRRVKHDKNYVD